MKKKGAKVVVTHVSLSVEQVNSPGDDDLTTSKFKNLEDWLFNLCASEIPTKVISTYKFGVFKSIERNRYVVYFAGFNTYGSPNNSTTLIDFKPVHQYYQLKESEIENLSWSQVLNKLTTDLKNFTDTQQFKNSFFARANLIETNFGETIWSNGEHK